ncbi:sensor histidine kinase [Oryzicola mucosus]|uniref:histidine kinase n=1 Tax=Oryzicola mucosus TaxID=2767425 RepID=A0A8J6PRY3_9HYPH|nr:HWE histidine kinase domain-containing protein [Oryzicola mucosus]MBD0417255.1 GAF domain-containing protein [Oryzicola mucosus]
MVDQKETGALPERVVEAVNDPRRLSVLQGLEASETVGDADFDRIAKLASTIMDAPVALVSLVDIDRQWFRSAVGLTEHETPIDQSFCAHAIAGDGTPMVVLDASADPRFAQNPLVTGEHHLRFYAGVPMRVADVAIGTLCVIDRQPRAEPPPARMEQLRALAELAASLFSLKAGTRAGEKAQVALVREERRRAIAIEAASLASWVWDARSGVVECDELLPELLGLPTTTRMRARDVFTAIDRRDLGKTGTMFRDTLADSDEYFGEYRVRGTEPSRWLATRGRVVERDSDGRAILVFGVNYDITEARAANERQRLLLRELNHRVKNTLATVQALATQTVRHARNPGDFLEAFSARLRSLGLAHGLLSDHEWRGISIRELIRTELQPFQDAARPRIALRGQDVLLSPDQAVGLALVLHELGSNAVKYGSLSVPRGSVLLEWSVRGREDKRLLDMSWSESGGPAVTEPAHHGFGSILIKRGLAKVLSSEVIHEFRPEGVYAGISMPLASAEETHL